jgi:hypothetical protein
MIPASAMPIPSNRKFLRAIPAVLVGVTAAIAVARFLAIDICLDRGGRITDTWLTCESGQGILLGISQYVGPGPWLLVLLSGILAAFLARRFLARRLS